MKSHIEKISRLLSKEYDISEHLTNILSYNLTFFEKLVISRSLKFAFLQKVSAMDVQVCFETLYFRIKNSLSQTLNELANATLRSIAVNYIERKNLCRPKVFVRAINTLKKRNNIETTKPDKGSGVVVIAI